MRPVDILIGHDQDFSISQFRKVLVYFSGLNIKNSFVQFIIVRNLGTSS